MWVYDFFAIISIWLGIGLTPYPIKVSLVCPYYNAALGARLGIHQDPNSPPPCFVMEAGK